MRSKTSCFNRTLFLTAVKRFWPLWGAYLAIWVLSLPLPLFRDRQYGWIDELDYLERIYSLGFTEGLILSILFSLFSAMAVWSFLYNARSASGLASLPVKREGQFLSALGAGFLPLAAGNLVTVLLTLPYSLLTGYDPLVLLEFFCIVTLLDLFFFGFATLCAQLTGHILILPAVYLVLNFAAAAAEWLLRSELAYFVYGMDSRFADGFALRWLSPPLGLSMGAGPEMKYANTGEFYEPVQVIFRGWGVLLAYGAAGVVCILLALVLFRRRRMETAGDVVAVGFLRPVFRWCMALGCGLVLSAFMLLVLYDNDSNAFGILLVFFLLGAFVGWFAAEMLLKKAFRVFRKRAWGGFGICCAVILALMLSLRFDLFGYERRVPEVSQISSAAIHAGGSSAALTQPENLEALTALHRQIIGDKDLNQRRGLDRRSPMLSALDCRIVYTLKNGQTMTRYYYLAFDYYDPARIGEAAGLEALMNVREAISSRNDFSFPSERSGDTDVYCTVSVTMTGAECVRLSGCADPEDYVLTRLLQYSPAEVRAMDPAKRRSLTAGFLGDLFGRELNYADPRELEDLYLDYTLSLNAREAEALYRDCLVPDLEAGTLGKVWLLPGREQEAAEYAAGIELRWERRLEDGDYDRDDLTLYPTVDSRRTNAWLEGRGLRLHTVGEVRGERYER